MLSGTIENNKKANNVDLSNNIEDTSKMDYFSTVLVLLILT